MNTSSRAALPESRPKYVRQVGILGMGCSVPDNIVTNFDLEERLDTTDEWIRTRTGIEERRIAEEGLCSSDLGTRAAQDALADAGLKAEDLDLIIVATLTPDTFMPATACRIQSRLGASRAGAFDLSVACSGFAYGLTVAEQFIAVGGMERVLVVGVDTLSRVLNWEDRATAVLFGDGAGAAVLGPVGAGAGILGIHFGADGAGGEMLKIPAGGGQIPASTPGLTPTDFCVFMSGRGVYRFAVQKIGQAAFVALEKAGIDPGDVDLFIPHQANLRIIESAADRLGVPMEKVFINVQKYGNTSAASLPIAMVEARDAGLIQAGTTLVTVGFGGGLAWCALVIRWV